MRHSAVKVFVLISALTTLALGLPNDPPPLQLYPGTGMFLMLSDIHFDPYSDPKIMEQLGVKPLPACQAPASPDFAKYGSDTNYRLLKSTLNGVVAAAEENHFHYDYVIVTGDLLAHDFDVRYHQCVGGGNEGYRKFAGETMRFVDAMLAKALPGVPVFAALGNNDSDRGDYLEPTSAFLQSVGQDWSRRWAKVPAARRAAALASFERAGNYALPHPTVANNELVILNSNFWSANNAQACSGADPDPGGQFQWLEEALSQVKRDGGTATLVMHILPGIDGMRSSVGPPTSLWTVACTQKLIAELSEFRGVVREMYAGHIHRDDFRLFPDAQGRPLCAIHINPAVSPVYLNNPAFEIGWYDKSTGGLRDYAALSLDLGSAKPAWTTEYVFSRAYGQPQPNLAALESLSREIHQGDPHSGVGQEYAKFYGAGVDFLLSPATWLNYTCAQTEITLSSFVLCKNAAGRR